MKKCNSANICIECKNACGGCSWTRWDEARKRVAFEPVPGWTAEKVPFRGMNSAIYGAEAEYTYKITACPQFERG